MTKPAYVSDWITEEQYNKWSPAGRGPAIAFEQVETAQEAAAFLMISFVESNSREAEYLLRGDAHSLSPIDQLINKNGGLVLEGLNHALEEYDLSYGVEPLCRLVQTYIRFHQDGQNLLSLDAVLQLLELAGKLKKEAVSACSSPERYIHDTAISAAMHHIENDSADAGLARDAVFKLAQDWLQFVHIKGPRQLNDVVLRVVEKFASDNELADFRKSIAAMYRLFEPTGVTQQALQLRYPRISALLGERVSETPAFNPPSIPPAVPGTF